MTDQKKTRRRPAVNENSRADVEAALSAIDKKAAAERLRRDMERREALEALYIMSQLGNERMARLQDDLCYLEMVLKRIRSSSRYAQGERIEEALQIASDISLDAGAIEMEIADV